MSSHNTGKIIVTDLIYYHASCADGFAAAWVACNALRHQGRIPVIRVLPHSEFPSLIDEFHTLEEKKLSIWFIDICPPRGILLSLREAFPQYKIRILDHHISAQNDCGDLPYCYFSQGNSGTSLAWIWFHDGPLPKLIRCIRDRDLWLNVEPDVDAILAFQGTRTTSFETLDYLLTALEDPKQYAEIVQIGAYLLMAKQKAIARLASLNLHYVALKTSTGTILCPALNSADYQSDIGNLIAQNNPISLVWYRNQNKIHCSLRSERNNPTALDCTDIAQQYGGGGHRHAAGFVLTLEEATEILFSSY